MGILAESMRTSSEWTNALLFNPFNLRKWIKLAIIAGFAGYLTVSSLNVNFPKTKNADAIIHSLKNRPPVSLVLKKAFSLLNHQKSRFMLGLIIFFVVLTVVFLLWLYAQFSFVFIHAIVTNKTTIALPFLRYRHQAWSFFRGMLLYQSFFVITAGIIGVLAWKALAHSLPDTHAIRLLLISSIKILFPYALAGIILFFLGLLFNLIVRDFCLPIMARISCGFSEALKKSLKIISEYKSSFFLYVLLRGSLAMFLHLIIDMLMLAIIAGLLMPFLGIVLFGLSIARLLHPGFLTPMLISAGLSFFIVFVFINITIRLPVCVFLRTLSLKFIANLKPELNLFH